MRLNNLVSTIINIYYSFHLEFLPIQFTDNYAEILKQIFKTVVDEKLTDSAVILKQITEKINSLEAKRSKIIDLYTDEGIEKEDLKQKLHEIRNEISRLRRKQNKVDFDKDTFTLNIAQAIDDIKNVEYWYNEASNQEKGEIIKSMAKYIDVYYDHIEIHWKDNYSLILKKGIYSNALNNEKVSNCTVMGACLDTVETIVQSIVDEYVFQIAMA